jgi:hypothetical protein
MPDRAKVTLRYVADINMISTSGALGRQRFRGNSGFDPDETGTGGQPANWDDFSVFYNRYVIVGSRITVVYYSTSAGAGGTLNAVTYPYNVTAVTTVPDGIAQPYSVSQKVGAIPGSWSTYMSSSKILGRNVRTSDACQAQYNANPSDVWYWDTVYQAIDGAATTTVYATYILDYDVEWYDRVTNGIDAHYQRVSELMARKKEREAKKSLCERKGEFAPGGASADEDKDIVIVADPGSAPAATPSYTFSLDMARYTRQENATPRSVPCAHVGISKAQVGPAVVTAGSTSKPSRP